MYIRNIDNTNKRFYYCSNVIGKYLIKSGIPLLSRNNNKMVFVKTNELQKAINKMPLYLRFLIKVGVING